ncbi:MAG TPA: hypothetical protein VGM39_25170 [Kofleriaceae bacterium]|jgi:hypothetical protein
MTALLLVASFASTHSAPPPTTIRVDSSTSASVHDVQIDTDVRHDGVAAYVTFTLESQLPVPSVVSVPITVSADARITNMDVQTVGAPLMVGQWGEREVSLGVFEDAVKNYRDPGLLELVRTSGDMDFLRLRVFPVEKGKPAQVTLYMFFAGGNELLVYGNGERVQRSILPGYADADRAPHLPDDRVTSTSSLVAAPRRER